MKAGEITWSQMKWSENTGSKRIINDVTGSKNIGSEKRLGAKILGANVIYNSQYICLHNPSKKMLYMEIVQRPNGAAA